MADAIPLTTAHLAALDSPRSVQFKAGTRSKLVTCRSPEGDRQEVVSIRVGKEELVRLRSYGGVIAAGIACINVGEAIMIQISHGTRLDVAVAEGVGSLSEGSITIVEPQFVTRSRQEKVDPSIVIKVPEHTLDDIPVNRDSGISCHVGEGPITIIPHD